MRFFKLPDLGEGLQEAEIVEWHAKTGDTVAVDQLLVSVETAKAIVDIPAPQAGQLAQSFGAVGDLLHIGDPLVEYANEQDTATVVGNLSSASSDDYEEQEDFFIVGAPAQTPPAAAPLVSPNPIPRQPASASPTAATPLPTGAMALRGARRTMAKVMQDAQQQVAQVTLCEDADIQRWPPHTDTTARLCRAISSAVAAEPTFNAWFDSTSLSLTVHPQIDLGIAVDSPDGLFVPILRNIGERSPSEIRAGINQFRRDVEARSIAPKAMLGATFTLSNFGSLAASAKLPGSSQQLAGRYASPMVVPPCVAILGAGGARATPVAVMNESAVDSNKHPAHHVAVHRLLPLSLSFDHRALSGGEAERFLAACIADLELAE